MAAEVTASTPSAFQPKGVRESDTSITKARLIRTAAGRKEEGGLEELLSSFPQIRTFERKSGMRASPINNIAVSNVVPQEQLC